MNINNKQHKDNTFYSEQQILYYLPIYNRQGILI